MAAYLNELEPEGVQLSLELAASASTPRRRPVGLGPVGGCRPVELADLALEPGELAAYVLQRPLLLAETLDGG